MTSRFETATVCKVAPALGLVFGWAIVSKVDGQPYFDLQDEHVPEDVMLNGAAEFMAESRAAREMHVKEGEPHGEVLFAFPMTDEVAAALEITTKKTGLLIAMKPSPEVLAKFVSGEYTGFSIGGSASYKDAQ